MQWDCGCPKDGRADFVKTIIQAACGMADFFKRMAEEHGSGFGESLSFLSSHPSSEERVETARAAALPGEDSMSEADWQALRQICAEQD